MSDNVLYWGRHVMNIELTDMEFRRLLDMVYIGNWILNSTRGDDRLSDYDHVESKIFAQCVKVGMHTLFEIRGGEDVYKRQSSTRPKRPPPEHHNTPPKAYNPVA